MPTAEPLIKIEFSARDGVYCAIPGCDRRAILKPRSKNTLKGLCEAHGRRVQRTGNYDIKTLVSQRVRKWGPVCLVEGCHGLSKHKGLCGMHYTRQYTHGDVGEPHRMVRAKGEGGRTEDGYVVLYRPEHPMARKAGYVLEHVKVMSDLLGRHLLPTETVHHKNGIKDDNHPLNLELWASRHPKGQRVQDQIEYAAKLLLAYAHDATLWPVDFDYLRNKILNLN